MNRKCGPTLLFSDRLHAEKHRLDGEDYRESCNRGAFALKDDDAHFYAYRDITLDMRFLPAGRIQRAMGAPHNVTPFNCFVSGTIEDSFVDDDGSIMMRASQAADTMRKGGGIGYDFSTLRPKGDPIAGVNAITDGPMAFLPIFDAVCKATSSAGNRRGAMMGVLRIDHPDIEDFIRVKQKTGVLEGFNLSIAVTDDFMECLARKGQFPLQFGGRVYRYVDAEALWEMVMRSTWDWGEPGVLFIDTINRLNNLNYCETIATSNPSMPAGTLVHTDKGVVQIEALEDNKFRVKSLDGTWAKAECFLSGKKQRLLEIDLAGGRTVRCTYQHRWPVLLNGRYIKVDASDLVPGDLIPANRNEPMGHCVDDTLSYTDGLMTGLAFGDGSYNIRKDDGRAYLSFHLNRNDIDLQTEVANYFGAKICDQSDESVVNIHKDSEARCFIGRVGLSFGDKSKLPSTVWASNDRFVAGFVDGLFSSDGHVNPSQKNMVFTNKRSGIGREVSILLGFHGVLSTVRDSVTNLNGKEYPRTDVCLSVNAVDRFSKLFTLTCQRKQYALDNITGRQDRRSNVASDHCRIKEIREVEPEDVWDIRVYHNQHVFPTEWVYTGNCGEQPLPPFGACLLGSFNLVRYLRPLTYGGLAFDWQQFHQDIPVVVRAMDNVIDRAKYPLPQQEAEALAKRRIGLGVTALANAGEALGHRYGSASFIEFEHKVFSELRRWTYLSSSELAAEKGSFPMFDADKYLATENAKRLPGAVREAIRRNGLRNSHLTSQAPTGTMSMTLDYVSSGIEPVFEYEGTRLVNMPEGQIEVEVSDYGYREFGVEGKLAKDVTAQEHLEVLAVASKLVDSAVSKTCNVDATMPWEDFKGLYQQAWELGCKGCTTFNKDGKRMGILGAKIAEPEGASCTIDEKTGRRDCS